MKKLNLKQVVTSISALALVVVLSGCSSKSETASTDNLAASNRENTKVATADTANLGASSAGRAR